MMRGWAQVRSRSSGTLTDTPLGSGQSPAIVLVQQREGPLTVNQLRRMALILFAAVATTYAQQGQWAAADPTAKFMIDAERE